MICRECRKHKSRSEFYEYTTTLCKDCDKKLAKIRHYKNKEKRNMQSKIWSLQNNKRKNNISKEWSKKNHEKVKKSGRLYYKKNPDKCKKSQNVRYAIYKAVKNNDIKKTKCELCNKKKVEIFILNYDKPLNIFWLCRKHSSYIRGLIRMIKKIQIKNNHTNS